MKKIMFNDRFGLTAAVLKGQKTMTRRIVPISLYNQTDWKAVEEDGNYNSMVDGEEYYHDIRECGKYRIGEVVAIAQRYCDVLHCADVPRGDEKGWGNKMFVKADLMPHHIKITDIKVERLQDCSEDDCLKEGIRRCNLNKKFAFDDKRAYNTAREAFAALIDKISGKGTWDSNPWCFCYEFKLID